MRLLRAPLLHFLALGALLHAGARWLPAGEPVVLREAQVQAWRADWQRETGRAPTPDQERAGLRHVADEEALLREALRLGLDRSDPVVRSRLVQNLRFADPGTTLGDGALVDAALALGMARSDLVVRRRLVQAMERRLADGVAVAPDEVEAYVHAHPQRYAAAARIALRHVFYSADRPDAEGRARRFEPGDPFLLGAEMPPQTPTQIARTFGSGFAAAVAALPPGQWSPPLRSAFGVHRVRVEAVGAPAAGDAEAVRREAYYALLEERERAARRAALDELRRRYPLELASR